MHTWATTQNISIEQIRRFKKRLFIFKSIWRTIYMSCRRHNELASDFVKSK